MKIPIRLLTVKMTFPGTGEGQNDVVTISRDNEMDISVKTSKNAIQIQNTCEISVAGLRTDIRQRLLTAFTAWNVRKTPTANYVKVEVFAGYSSVGVIDPTCRIFVGDIVKCQIGSIMPNAELRIEAFTRQIDRTDLVQATFPINATFKQLVGVVARAAGLVADCQTSYDDKSNIKNFGVYQVNPTGAPLRLNVQAAIVGLSALYPDSIAIWVDDDKLVARDIGRVVGTDITKIDLFIETPPSWTEWGVTFKTLFNPSVKLGGAVELSSQMNPGVNGQFIVTGIEYDLSPRQNSFYISVKASPPGRVKGS